MTPRTNYLLAVLFSLSLATEAFAASVTRTLRIESEPAGATVSQGGRELGFTPLPLSKVSIRSDTILEYQITKEGYAPQSRKVLYDEVKTTKSSETIPVKVELVEIQRKQAVEVTSTPSGASVFINEKPAGPTPAQVTLVFSRDGKDAKWSSNKIRVQKENYLAQEKTVLIDGPSKQPFALAEILREVPVKIDVNIPDATVRVDGVTVGQTSAKPLETKLVYKRATGEALWPSLKLEIAKDGFEYRAAGTTPTNTFTQLVTVEAAATGLIEARSFFQARFVLSPLRTFEVEGAKVVVRRSRVHSAVDPSEGGGGSAPSPVTEAAPSAPLVLSRITTAIVDAKEQVVYSIPVWEPRPGAKGNAADEDIVGANIWMRSGKAQTPITHGRFFDIDPFITTDGKVVYYSSDRFAGGRCIIRQTVGKPALSKLTGGSIDTEPAASPDGQEVAYTSRAPDAATGTPPMIWVMKADGSLPRQLRAGHSPAWSPDSKKIAFVSEFKIWVMDADGGGQSQLTHTLDSKDLSPIFVPPLGKRLIYSSNQGKADLGLPNFDLWIMDLDGSAAAPLTTNGSFDSCPAVNANGTTLYFFSNRGAPKTDEEGLQVLRMNLAQ